MKMVAAALFALVVPAGLSAQEAAPTNTQIQEWFVEMQELHGRLGALQTRALQDPQLHAEQEALGVSIKTAMEKFDPRLQQSLARMQSLESEAVAAEQAGDEAKIEELEAEAQAIQEQFLLAQQHALQDSAIASRVQSFQTKLERKMSQLDPQAEALIARFQELEMKLALAMREAQQR